MSDRTIQEFLFEQIKEKLSPDKSLADAIADALYISQDSAYRRIRGETLLVLEEAKVLCALYDISLDQVLTSATDSVVFQTNPIGHGAGNFSDFLNGVLSEIRLLASAKQKSLIYLTNDIPLFHQFAFQPFFAFRYYAWMKTYLEPHSFDPHFSISCLPQDIQQSGEEISEIFSDISSIEILNTECVNNTLQLINHYAHAGMITKKDSALVITAMHECLDHMQLQAAFGCKYKPGKKPQARKENYSLFWNRTGIGDHIILTMPENRKFLYLNYDALDYLRTGNEAFCNRVHLQLQNTIRRSTQISSVSEKQRNKFFNLLDTKLAHALQLTVKPAL